MPNQIEQLGAARLYLGNCLDILPKLDPVDAVIVDPPFGTTQCSWDAVIPLPDMWDALQPITTPRVPHVFFAAQPFTSALVMSNPRAFKYDWTWVKPKGTGHLNAKKQPLRDKEDILVFYKKPPVYNPQFTKGKPYKARGGKRHENDCYGTHTSKRNDNEGKRYPRQTIFFAIEERNRLHPTQKPVALMEYLIRTYTNPGDIVLDFAMGAGSTGVAALRCGRRFIGIEIDQEYFDAACGRISEVKVDAEHECPQDEAIRHEHQ